MLNKKSSEGERRTVKGIGQNQSDSESCTSPTSFAQNLHLDAARRLFHPLYPVKAIATGKPVGNRRSRHLIVLPL